MADFSRWTAKYLAADAAQRPALVEEGENLATLRRAELADLIRRDPEQALAVAVPFGVRSQMPGTIAAQFEKRVSGRGDYAVLATVPREDAPAAAPAIIRQATIGKEEFTAYVFGDRVNQRTALNVSLHGIALEGALALSDSTVRVLDPGEPPTPGKKQVDPVCSVSGEQAAAAGQPPKAGGLLVESGDAVHWVCRGGHIEAVEHSVAAEEGGNGGQGQVAASYQTTGTRKMLVMLVDFSDATGGPVSQSTAQSYIDEVCAFIKSNAFNQIDFTVRTVTPLLRMPRTASYYVANNNGLTPLLTDARTAAANAGYSSSTYDFDVVAFKNVGFNYGGIGYVGAKGSLVQGSFSKGTTAHELGHNFGNWHANAWQSSTVIGTGGTHVEYGNSFDVLGKSQYFPNHHSANFKYLNGWLPASYLHTVSASGTYRVYAQDFGGNLDASRKYGIRIPAGINLPQRVNQYGDAVPATTVDYWLDFRQQLQGSLPATADGLVVQWGGNTVVNGASLLLDTRSDTLGNFNDAPLGVGRTFNDSSRSISITTLAKGGTGTGTYLDVQISYGSNAPVTLAQALELAGATWTTGGNAPWAGQTLVSYDGFDAAASGGISDNQESYLQTTITGPGTLAFWWKVSSEASFDYLRYLSNGVEVAAISGEQNWQQKSYPLGPGVHTLKWRYSKDGSARFGSDSGWLDQVTFTPASIPPSIQYQPANQAVNAGSNALFTVQASGTAPLAYQWRKNGVNVSGATNTALQLYFVQATDAGTYSVVVSNPYGSVTSSNASLTVVQPLTLEQALDTTNVTWRTGGVTPWLGQTGVTHDGLDAAASGSISHDQESWVEATFTGPGTLTFWWKVSSEGNFDVLTVAMDGTAQQGISGEVNWSTKTMAIPSGAHNVRWTYAKDSSESYGQDKAWVDQISFVTNATPPPVITGQPQNQTVPAGGTATFSVAATGTAPLGYQWRKNGGNLGGATNALLSVANVSTNDTGSYSVVVSNPGGSTTSSNALLTVLTPPPVVTLTNGVPYGGLADAQGGQRVFKLQVPSGQSQLVIRITGGNGDADLYVRFGAAPTRSTWDYRPYIGGNEEMVTVSSPASGDWYVMLDAFAPYSGVTLTAQYSGFQPPTITAQPQGLTVPVGGTAMFNVTATGAGPLGYQWRKNGGSVTGATNASLLLASVGTNDAGSYSVVVTNPGGSVTSGSATLTVTTSPVTNMVLNAVDSGWYDSTGFHDPGNRNYFVGKETSGTNLFRNWFVFDVPSLPGSVVSASLRLNTFTNSSPSGSEFYQLRHVNTPVTALRTGGGGLVATYDDLGDGDIYAGRNVGVSESGQVAQFVLTSAAISRLTASAGSSFAVGGEVTSLSPGASDEFLFGASHLPQATDIQLVLTFETGAGVVALTNGVPYGGLAGAQNGQRLFKLTVPPGQNRLEFRITGGSGDADLYVRFGASPTTETWDYRPYTEGNEETVTLNNPTAGDWYVMVHGYAAYSGVSVSAQYSSVQPPVITAQPQSQTVALGGAAAFSATATGTGPLVYQWRNNGGNLAGATNSVLSLANVGTNDAGSYSVEVSNSGGSVTSSNALLTVTVPPPLVVLTNGVPHGGLAGVQGSQRLFKLTVPAGQSQLVVRITGGSGDADLYVRFGASPTLSTWDFSPYLFGNEEVVTVSNPAAGDWYLMVHGFADYSGVSVSAEYTAGAQPPVITAQPQGQTVPAGGTATFSVSATGAGSLAYQWRKNGGSLPGATNAALSLASVSTNDAGSYSVVVSNSGGSVTSSNAQLTVIAPTAVIVLTNGVPYSGLADALGGQRLFKLPVPAGRSQLVVRITGGSGDADLYVRNGAAPTLTLWDYRPYLGGNEETVTIGNPAAGDWFIMLDAFASYSGVTLTAEHADPVWANLVFNPANGHYYQYVTNSVTWLQAKVDAETRVFTNGWRGHLATVQDAAENTFISTLVTSVSTAWIGAYQPPGSSEPAGGFRWVTGEPFNYANWASGEPNQFQGSNEETVVINGASYQNPGKWQDAPGGGSSVGYIVEYEPLALDSGLLAWWRFDEGAGTNVLDSSGNGIHGTFAGGVWQPGRVGNALSFTSPGSVTFGDNELLDGVVPMTLSFWFKPTTALSPGNPASFAYDKRGTMGLLVYVAAGDIQVHRDFLGEVDYHNAVFPAGQWVHYAVTVNNSRVEAYTNGVLAVAWNIARPVSANSEPAALVVEQGTMDDVRFYGRVLEPSEITTLASGVSAPSIAVQPQSQAVQVGQTATFTAQAAGTPTPAQIWQRSTDNGVTWSSLVDGGGVSGVTTNTLQVSGTTLGQSGHKFRLAATNSFGSAASASATLTVTNPVATSFVTRLLPPGYQPGTKFTVTLQSGPPASSQSHAVEDSPPVGWTVGIINNGGSFDTANRKVKYGPFFDNTARSLTYEVTPPANAMGVQTFAGTASVDGANTPISGPSALDRVQRHPADNNPGDDRITIAEVTAYGAAWKTGSIWPLDPNPIPISYVTRAGALWKAGETYRLDTTITNSPLWWVNTTAPSAQAALRFTTGLVAQDLVGAGSAVADLPAGFQRDRPLGVTVRANPAPGVQAYAVEDQIPPGWVVVNNSVSDGGAFDGVSRKVKWGPFFDNTPRTLSYSVNPKTNSALAGFVGTASFDGADVAIAGRRASQRAPFMPENANAGRNVRNNGFRILTQGEPGRVYVLESSETPWLPNSWIPLVTNLDGATDLDFTDYAVSNRVSRFYRVIER